MDSPLNNSFEFVLRHLRKGKCLHELSGKLQDAVLEVRSLGKPATVTLTLKINPFGDAAVCITDDIVAKLPVANKTNSIFFATDEGSLLRHDPNQTEMKLTTVNPQPQKDHATQSLSKSA